MEKTSEKHLFFTYSADQGESEGIDPAGEGTSTSVNYHYAGQAIDLTALITAAKPQPESILAVAYKNPVFAQMIFDEPWFEDWPPQYQFDLILHHCPVFISAMIEHPSDENSNQCLKDNAQIYVEAFIQAIRLETTTAEQIEYYLLSQKLIRFLPFKLLKEMMLENKATLLVYKEILNHHWKNFSFPELEKIYEEKDLCTLNVNDEKFLIYLELQRHFKKTLKQKHKEKDDDDLSWIKFYFGSKSIDEGKLKKLGFDSLALLSNVEDSPVLFELISDDLIKYLDQEEVAVDISPGNKEYILKILSKRRSVLEKIEEINKPCVQAITTNPLIPDALSSHFSTPQSNSSDKNFYLEHLKTIEQSSFVDQKNCTSIAICLSSLKFKLRDFDEKIIEIIKASFSLRQALVEGIYSQIKYKEIINISIIIEIEEIEEDISVEINFIMKEFNLFEPYIQSGLSAFFQESLLKLQEGQINLDKQTFPREDLFVSKLKDKAERFLNLKDHLKNFSNGKVEDPHAALDFVFATIIDSGFDIVVYDALVLYLKDYPELLSAVLTLAQGYEQFQLSRALEVEIIRKIDELSTEFEDKLIYLYPQIACLYFDSHEGNISGDELLKLQEIHNEEIEPSFGLYHVNYQTRAANQLQTVLRDISVGNGKLALQPANFEQHAAELLDEFQWFVKEYRINYEENKEILSLQLTNYYKKLQIFTNLHPSLSPAIEQLVLTFPKSENSEYLLLQWLLNLAKNGNEFCNDKLHEFIINTDLLTLFLKSLYPTLNFSEEFIKYFFEKRRLAVFSKIIDDFVSKDKFIDLICLFDLGVIPRTSPALDAECISRKIYLILQNKYFKGELNEDFFIKNKKTINIFLDEKIEFLDFHFPIVLNSLASCQKKLSNQKYIKLIDAIVSELSVRTNEFILNKLFELINQTMSSKMNLFESLSVSLSSLLDDIVLEHLFDTPDVSHDSADDRMQWIFTNLQNKIQIDITSKPKAAVDINDYFSMLTILNSQFDIIESLCAYIENIEDADDAIGIMLVWLFKECSQGNKKINASFFNDALSVSHVKFLAQYYTANTFSDSYISFIHKEKLTADFLSTLSTPPQNNLSCKYLALYLLDCIPEDDFLCESPISPARNRVYGRFEEIMIQNKLNVTSANASILGNFFKDDYLDKLDVGLYQPLKALNLPGILFDSIIDYELSELIRNPQLEYNDWLAGLHKQILIKANDMKNCDAKAYNREYWLSTWNLILGILLAIPMAVPMIFSDQACNYYSSFFDQSGFDEARNSNNTSINIYQSLEAVNMN